MNKYNNEEKKRPISASAVVRLVIWSVVLCILVALFAVSMVGDYLQLDWVGVSMLQSIVIRYDEEDYTVGGGKSDAVITDLSIEWIAGSVTVVATEGNEIVISEDYDGEAEKMQLRWKIENRELSVKYCKPHRFIGKEATKKNLTVAIPTSMLASMGSVDIEGVDCDVRFTGNADELALEVVEGDLTIDGDIGELDVESVDGHVSFRGGVRRAEVECVNAAVDMNLEMAIELRFDQVNGDVTLCLSEAITGFSAERESLGGSLVTEGFDGVDRTANTARWGDNSLRIWMDGVNCQLKIEKTKKG